MTYWIFIGLWRYSCFQQKCQFNGTSWQSNLLQCQTTAVYSDINTPKVMKIQTCFTKHYLQSSCSFTAPLGNILTFQFLKNESNIFAQCGAYCGPARTIHHMSHWWLPSRVHVDLLGLFADPYKMHLKCTLQQNAMCATSREGTLTHTSCEGCPVLTERLDDCGLFLFFISNEENVCTTNDHTAHYSSFWTLSGTTFILRCCHLNR